MRGHRRLAVPLAILAVTAIGLPMAAAPASAAVNGDLLISEYVEGSSNNKALEIFNGTGTAVDLAAGGYRIEMYFNGATSAGTSIALSGTVAAGDVFVLAQAAASPEILSRADQTSAASFYNGDDAVVLRRGGAGGAILDVIGQIGVDPGSEWGTGAISTQDNTLRRKASVTVGDTDAGDPFDPAAEWDGLPVDTVDGLGLPPGADGGGGDPGTPPVLTVGEVQGSTTDAEDGQADRSPLAPPSGNGSSAQYYDVRGVITQRTLARNSYGGNQYGFFLQSRLGATDGDPTSSDGVFVYMGGYTSLIGGYVPTVGDEVVLHARVSEYYNFTELSSASLVEVLDSGLDVARDVAVTDAVPPADLAAAQRFWERHEGEQMRVRAGSVATSGRDVFASTADAEVWLVDADDPLLARTDPYARRVFRDPHPLDNHPERLFDDGNGQRIMLGSLGIKWAARDNTALLPPARTLDTLDADAVGGVYYSYGKYGVQVTRADFAAGPDPAANHPPRPADRSREVSVATFNVENLYDFRDDPFDGCDFAGNAGCPGVSPPFDYVPADEAAYRQRLADLAGQIVTELHAPDLLLVQEAEDQDICTIATVGVGEMVCGTTDNADGAPDTLQDLALAVASAGGPSYAAAYDRDGADDRGITAAFLYRTDRLSLAGATAVDPVLGSAPAISYRGTALPTNADVQNPKALNAVLPSDVDTSTGVDGSNVYTRAPQVARFVVAAAPGSAESYPLWAVSNHFSSGPDSRVGQRTEQARYGAAIINAVEAADPAARIVYGGDLNVYPRPDDPVADGSGTPPSDQLAALYDAGMHNLWEDLAADAPSAAYSYVYQGQAQTLDHLFVSGPLYGDLVRMRAAHVNADWPAEYAGDGPRGVSDHDPQVATFRSRASLSVADARVVEGDKGTSDLTFTVSFSRALSRDVLVCATTAGLTAWPGSDYTSMAGCRTLPAGATALTFTVAVRGDRRVEPDEKLALLVGAIPGVELADPLAIGTIVNDD